LIQSNPLARARYRRADRVIAVSQLVAKAVIASGLPPEKVSVVYCGVEMPGLTSPEARRLARKRWEVGDEHHLLGCVGALQADKGQEALIRALPRLLSDFPTCRLLLAGKGPCQPVLERVAGELGVESAVVFAGFVAEIEQVYSALDVFLFPALAEGLGSSLLAAMAHGVPAVAMNSGAAAEVIDDGRTGLLLSDRNPATIATSVGSLLRDCEYARNLGAAARENVGHRYSADRMVEETLRAYRELARPAERR
jgi:glycosyltransferase involved in cell wall biosynthesis